MSRNGRGLTADEIDFIVKDLRASMTLIAGTIASMIAERDRLKHLERFNRIRAKRK